MIPNIITSIRFISIFPLAFYVYNYGITNIIPLIIFLLIIITDSLDGYIARKYNMITSFGKIFDPIVDKTLVIVMTIVLIKIDVLPIYTLFIYVRDIIIIILSLLLINKRKKVHSANIYGKIKTVLHFFAIAFVLLLGKWNNISLILLILGLLTLIPELIYRIREYNISVLKIINKKENNKKLSYKELEYVFNSYIDNNIDDETMTKLLKAICKNNLNEEEIFNLTDIFIKSGDTLDLKGIDVVDKHSTGGVGDKTTLILLPILAANDVKVAKMSGRGLGFTGGTIDKLESINVNINLTEEEFIKGIKKVGFSITGQTKNLCPMDKKIYALRDVTNTVENNGLIATSIMSKKIACGAKKILIDIKVGNGALIKTKESAMELANIMIKIGKKYNREVRCMLTNMDNPLGNNIGNSIEIMEVIDILQDKVHNNLYDLVVEMASEIISMDKNINIKEAKEKVLDCIANKQAYNKFLEFVDNQNGDINIKIDEGTKIYSNKEGYINKINSKELGLLSMNLGAGRKKKEDKIDYNAGIILNKNIGDYIKEKELLCTLYGKKDIKIDINKIFKIEKEKDKKENIIINIIK